MLAGRAGESGVHWIVGGFAVLVTLAVLGFGAVLWMTSVPGRSHSGPLPPLTAEEARLAERLREHVQVIGSRPHNVAYQRELEQAALYIEEVLASLGYQLRRQTYEADGLEVRNIEVMIEPATAAAETLVLGAHYDSYLFAPGANDNATGVAAVLELARLLRDLRNRSPLRIRLVLFVNEEPPFSHSELMGSLVYARALNRSGEPVLGMMSLETLGCYTDAENSQNYPWPLGLLYPSTGNFVAFVGLVSSRCFVRRTVETFRGLVPFPSVGGTAPGFIPGIDWSDHWSFEQVGIPALMITDTALYRYPYYHTIEDTPDKVDYDKLARIVAGLAAVVRHWAQVAN